MSENLSFVFVKTENQSFLINDAFRLIEGKFSTFSERIIEIDASDNRNVNDHYFSTTVNLYPSYRCTPANIGSPLPVIDLSNRFPLFIGFHKKRVKIKEYIF